MSAKEKLAKKNKAGAAFTDDGFAMGMCFDYRRESAFLLVLKESLTSSNCWIFTRLLTLFIGSRLVVSTTKKKRFNLVMK